MTKQEFETLTGLTVNLDQFEEINAMYMVDDNQTKQEFCKMFVENKAMMMWVVNLVVRHKEEKEALRRQVVEERELKDGYCEMYQKQVGKAVAMQQRLDRIAEMVKGGEE